MATVAIGAAGGTVIIMILLILAYLLYVALPLRSVAKLDAPSAIKLPLETEVVVAGGQLLKLPAGIVTADGRLRNTDQHTVYLSGQDLYVLTPPALVAGEGQEIVELHLRLRIPVSAVSPQSLSIASAGTRLLYAYFDTEDRLVVGGVNTPIEGEDAVQRFAPLEGSLADGVIRVDAASGTVVVVQDRSYLWWQPNRDGAQAVPGSLEGLDSAAKRVAWGPNYETLLIVDELNQLHRFDVARSSLPRLGEPQPTSMTVRWLKSESRRRVSYLVGEDGELAVMVPSSGEELLRRIVPELAGPGDFGIVADGSAVYRLTDVDLISVGIRNPFPETGWRSLWLPQWFGAYDAPAHFWHPDGAAIGALSKLSLSPLLYGTFKAALYGMLLAVPLALGAAVYTGYFLPPRIRNRIKPSIEMLEAFPTVVLGFVAGLWLAPLLLDYLLPILLLPVLLLGLPILLSLIHLLLQLLSPRFQRRPPRMAIVAVVYLAAVVLLVMNASYFESWLFEVSLRDWLWREWGIAYEQRNALLVGMAMGVAITPVMFSIVEDSIFAVPRSLSDGSLALGATRWQSLARVVLPAASPAILSALLIGLARGLGETMIVLLATGNTPLMEPGAFSGLRSLSASIAVELPEAGSESVQFRLLFLAALVLFGLTFVLNTVAELFRQRLRYAYANR
ncbi:ABC transporter permease subunit [Congregibacter sp.]|uniref:ABC transporter permease subunit n=1 Tax=Congregibacter sp. TaxID=2744308 RepID=UPI0038587EC7